MPARYCRSAIAVYESAAATLVLYYLRFALPTFLGNTTGGVLLVAVLTHLPLREELLGQS